jgi:hypothetical protein
MNHSTPNIALPDSDSHFIIRPRIDVLGSRLDDLLSILCKWVLRLMPALFVVAHTILKFATFTDTLQP